MHCSTLQANCCSMLLCKASCQHSSPTELASIKICSSHKCGHQTPMQCSTTHRKLLLPIKSCCSVKSATTKHQCTAAPCRPIAVLCYCAKQAANYQVPRNLHLSRSALCTSVVTKHQCNAALSFKSCYSLMCATTKHQCTAAPCRSIAVLCYCAKQAAFYQIPQNLHLSRSALHTSVVTKHQCNAALPIKSCCSLKSATTKHQCTAAPCRSLAVLCYCAKQAANYQLPQNLHPSGSALYTSVQPPSTNAMQHYPSRVATHSCVQPPSTNALQHLAGQLLFCVTVQSKLPAFKSHGTCIYQDLLFTQVWSTSTNAMQHYLSRVATHSCVQPPSTNALQHLTGQLLFCVTVQSKLPSIKSHRTCIYQDLLFTQVWSPSTNAMQHYPSRVAAHSSLPPLSTNALQHLAGQLLFYVTVQSKLPAFKSHGTCIYQDLLFTQVWSPNTNAMQHYPSKVAAQSSLPPLSANALQHLAGQLLFYVTVQSKLPTINSHRTCIYQDLLFTQVWSPTTNAMQHYSSKLAAQSSLPPLGTNALQHLAGQLLFCVTVQSKLPAFKSHGTCIYQDLLFTQVWSPNTNAMQHYPSKVAAQSSLPPPSANALQHLAGQLLFYVTVQSKLPTINSHRTCIHQDLLFTQVCNPQAPMQCSTILQELLLTHVCNHQAPMHCSTLQVNCCSVLLCKASCQLSTSTELASIRICSLHKCATPKHQCNAALSFKSCYSLMCATTKHQCTAAPCRSIAVLCYCAKQAANYQLPQNLHPSGSALYTSVQPPSTNAMQHYPSKVAAQSSLPPLSTNALQHLAGQLLFCVTVQSKLPAFKSHGTCIYQDLLFAQVWSPSTNAMQHYPSRVATHSCVQPPSTNALQHLAGQLLFCVTVQSKLPAFKSHGTCIYQDLLFTQVWSTSTNAMQHYLSRVATHSCVQPPSTNALQHLTGQLLFCVTVQSKLPSIKSHRTCIYQDLLFTQLWSPSTNAMQHYPSRVAAHSSLPPLSTNALQHLAGQLLFYVTVQSKLPAFKSHGTCIYQDLLFTQVWSPNTNAMQHYPSKVAAQSSLPPLSANALQHLAGQLLFYVTVQSKLPTINSHRTCIYQDLLFTQVWSPSTNAMQHYPSKLAAQSSLPPLSTNALQQLAGQLLFCVTVQSKPPTINSHRTCIYQDLLFAQVWSTSTNAMQHYPSRVATHSCVQPPSTNALQHLAGQLLFCVTVQSKLPSIKSHGTCIYQDLLFTQVWSTSTNAMQHYPSRVATHSCVQPPSTNALQHLAGQLLFCVTVQSKLPSIKSHRTCIYQDLLFTQVWSPSTNAMQHYPSKVAAQSSLPPLSANALQHLAGQLLFCVTVQSKLPAFKSHGTCIYQDLLFAQVWSPSTNAMQHYPSRVATHSCVQPPSTNALQHLAGQLLFCVTVQSKLPSIKSHGTCIYQDLLFTQVWSTSTNAMQHYPSRVATHSCVQPPSTNALQHLAGQLLFCVTVQSKLPSIKSHRTCIYQDLLFTQVWSPSTNAMQHYPSRVAAHSSLPPLSTNALQHLAGQLLFYVTVQSKLPAFKSHGTCIYQDLLFTQVWSPNTNAMQHYPSKVAAQSSLPPLSANALQHLAGQLLFYVTVQSKLPTINSHRTCIYQDLLFTQVWSPSTNAMQHYPSKLAAQSSLPPLGTNALQHLAGQLLFCVTVQSKLPAFKSHGTCIYQDLLFAQVWSPSTNAMQHYPSRVATHSCVQPPGTNALQHLAGQLLFCVTVQSKLPSIKSHRTCIYQDLLFTQVWSPSTNAMQHYPSRVAAHSSLPPLSTNALQHLAGHLLFCVTVQSKLPTINFHRTCIHQDLLFTQVCNPQAPMQCSTILQELLLTHVCNHQAPMHCSTLQVNCCSVLLCKASCQLSTSTELASIRICSLHKCATPKHQCNAALPIKSCCSVKSATTKHQCTAAPCRPIAVLCYCAKQADTYQLPQNLHLSGSALYTSVVNKHQCNAALSFKSCHSLMCATTKHQCTAAPCRSIAVLCYCAKQAASIQVPRNLHLSRSALHTSVVNKHQCNAALSFKSCYSLMCATTKHQCTAAPCRSIAVLCYCAKQAASIQVPRNLHLSRSALHTSVVTKHQCNAALPIESCCSVKSATTKRQCTAAPCRPIAVLCYCAKQAANYQLPQNLHVSGSALYTSVQPPSTNAMQHYPSKLAAQSSLPALGTNALQHLAGQLLFCVTVQSKLPAFKSHGTCIYQDLLFAQVWSPSTNAMQHYPSRVATHSCVQPPSTNALQHLAGQLLFCVTVQSKLPSIKSHRTCIYQDLLFTQVWSPSTNAMQHYPSRVAAHSSLPPLSTNALQHLAGQLLFCVTVQSKLPSIKSHRTCIYQDLLFTQVWSPSTNAMQHYPSRVAAHSSLPPLSTNALQHLAGQLLFCVTVQSKLPPINFHRTCIYQDLLFTQVWSPNTNAMQHYPSKVAAQSSLPPLSANALQHLAGQLLFHVTVQSKLPAFKSHGTCIYQDLLFTQVWSTSTNAMQHYPSRVATHSCVQPPSTNALQHLAGQLLFCVTVQSKLPAFKSHGTCIYQDLLFTQVWSPSTNAMQHYPSRVAAHSSLPPLSTNALQHLAGHLLFCVTVQSKLPTINFHRTCIHQDLLFTQVCNPQAPMQCSTILQELLLTHVCNHQAPMHCSTLQVNCCSVLLCKASCQLSTSTELASIRICSLHKCATPKHQCNAALPIKSCCSVKSATTKHQCTAAPCRPIAVLCYCAKQADTYQLPQNLHLSGSALYTSVVNKHQCNAALSFKSCHSLMCATTKHQCTAAPCRSIAVLCYCAKQAASIQVPRNLHLSRSALHTSVVNKHQCNAALSFKSCYSLMCATTKHQCTAAPCRSIAVLCYCAKQAASIQVPRNLHLSRSALHTSVVTKHQCNAALPIESCCSVKSATTKRQCTAAPCRPIAVLCYCAKQAANYQLPQNLHLSGSALYTSLVTKHQCNAALPIKTCCSVKSATTRHQCTAAPCRSIAVLCYCAKQAASIQVPRNLHLSGSALYTSLVTKHQCNAALSFKSCYSLMCATTKHQCTAAPCRSIAVLCYCAKQAANYQLPQNLHPSGSALYTSVQPPSTNAMQHYPSKVAAQSSLPPLSTNALQHLAGQLLFYVTVQSKPTPINSHRTCIYQDLLFTQVWSTSTNAMQHYPSRVATHSCVQPPSTNALQHLAGQLLFCVTVQSKLPAFKSHGTCIYQDLLFTQVWSTSTNAMQHYPSRVATHSCVQPPSTNALQHLAGQLLFCVTVQSKLPAFKSHGTCIYQDLLFTQVWSPNTNAMQHYPSKVAAQSSLPPLSANALQHLAGHLLFCVTVQSKLPTINFHRTCIHQDLLFTQVCNPQAPMQCSTILQELLLTHVCNHQAPMHCSTLQVNCCSVLLCKASCQLSTSTELASIRICSLHKCATPKHQCNAALPIKSCCSVKSATTKHQCTAAPCRPIAVLCYCAKQADTYQLPQNLHLSGSALYTSVVNKHQCNAALSFKSCHSLMCATTKHQCTAAPCRSIAVLCYCAKQAASIQVPRNLHLSRSALHTSVVNKHQCNAALSFKSCYSLMCATTKHQCTAAPCRSIAVLCYCAKQAASIQVPRNLHLSRSALHTSVVTKHQCNAALPIESCCSVKSATTKRQCTAAPCRPIAVLCYCAKQAANYQLPQNLHVSGSALYTSVQPPSTNAMQHYPSKLAAQSSLPALGTNALQHLAGQLLFCVTVQSKLPAFKSHGTCIYQDLLFAQVWSPSTNAMQHYPSRVATHSCVQPPSTNALQHLAGQLLFCVTVQSKLPSIKSHRTCIYQDLLFTQVWSPSTNAMQHYPSRVAAHSSLPPLSTNALQHLAGQLLFCVTVQSKLPSIKSHRTCIYQDLLFTQVWSPSTNAMQHYPSRVAAHSSLPPLSTNALQHLAGQLLFCVTVQSKLPPINFHRTCIYQDLLFTQVWSPNTNAMQHYPSKVAAQSSLPPLSANALQHLAGQLLFHVTVQSKLPAFKSHGTCIYQDLLFTQVWSTSTNAMQHYPSRVATHSCVQPPSTNALQHLAGQLLFCVTVQSKLPAFKSHGTCIYQDLLFTQVWSPSTNAMQHYPSRVAAHSSLPPLSTNALQHLAGHLLFCVTVQSKLPTINFHRTCIHQDLLFTQVCNPQAPMQCSTILQELLLTHVCNHQAPMHCSTLQVNCCSVLLCKASCQLSTSTELASIRICSLHKCATPKHQCNAALPIKSCCSVKSATTKHQCTAAPCRPIAVLCYCAKQADTYQLPQNLHLSGSALYTSVVKCCHYPSRVATH